MPSPCDNLIQFDTQHVSNSLASMYSALQFVTMENYEQMKKDMSASVPGYFDGTYNEFKMKRNKLTSLFHQAGFTSLQQDYYRHTLSQAGAEAYARCVAEQSNKPLSAWIGARSEETLAVMVRCGLPGAVTMKVSVVGAQPLGGQTDYEVPGSGVITILFQHNQKKSFLIGLNASIGAPLNISAADTIFLPAIREFEIRTESKRIQSALQAGAGCQGNSAGCQISRELSFVADEGFSLDKSSIQRVSERVVFGPGIRAYEVQWIYDEADGVVRRAIGRPYNIDGNSGNTQGCLEVTYSIAQTREYVVEITS